MWRFLFALLFAVAVYNEVTDSVSVQPGLETTKDVIVVGGGLAGMAAARKLTNSPDKFAVKVLEACKDRYGGRVFTDRKGSVRGEA